MQHTLCTQTMQNYCPASLRVTIEYVGACNNLHYYPQMEQLDWSEMTYYNISINLVQHLCTSHVMYIFIKKTDNNSQPLVTFWVAIEQHVQSKLPIIKSNQVFCAIELPCWHSAQFMVKLTSVYTVACNPTCNELVSLAWISTTNKT